jgi:hypothetical protein
VLRLKPLHLKPDVVALDFAIEVDARQAGQTRLLSQEAFVTRKLVPVGVNFLRLLDDVI